MYVKCHELMKLPSFKQIRLVAGASGLSRMVSWIYVLTTSSLEGWLRGGELIFIIDTPDLARVLKEAAAYEVAGIVVLRSRENTTSLTGDLIDFANKEDLPLFDMDYDLKMVDITREISAYIMNKQKKVDYLGRFFHTILFQEHMDPVKMDDFMLYYGFQSEHIFFITTVHCENPSLQDDLQTSLEMYLEDPWGRFLMLFLDTHLVILAYAKPDRVESAKRLLKTAFAILDEKYPESFAMAIGSSCNTLQEVRKSYKSAMKSLELSSGETRFIDYEELGFPRLLVNAEEEVLEEYADFILKRVKEYDKKNNASFLRTMEAYILENGSISKTAARLYIHKNTCIYRIARIDELFQIDLNDPDTRADVMNCLKIYRFLGLESTDDR